MHRIALLLVCLVLLLAAPLSAALAEKRVALVIGNSAYEHVQHLPNPVNDAADMAAMLESLGFRVKLARDLGRVAMEEALAIFSDEAAGADLALVFFAGHGMEVDRQNYLIPVDAKLETDRRMRFETVSLEDVMAALEGVSGVRIVLLDACRNNPFAAAMKVTSSTRMVGRGLSRIEASRGTLISFSAKEGTVAADGEGRNSPYTAALLGNLRQPGLEISLLFRKVRDSVLAATGNAQEPYVSFSLSSEAVYLVPPTGELVPSPQPMPLPQPQLDPIAGDYALAERVGTKAAWEAFLARHGSEKANFHVQLAEAALKKVAALVPAPEIEPEVSAERDPPVHECDRLAKRPLDLQGGPAVAGVDGDDIDAPRALAACESAHRQYPGAQRFTFQLARVHEAAKNYGMAERLYRQVAHAGYAAAAGALARMFYWGRGVEKDTREAARWFRKAAEAGDPEGMAGLGYLLDNGEGVAKDVAEGLRWTRRAADAGHPMAMNNLGSLFDRGEGVAQDKSEAVRWFRKSAEAGEPFGMRNLALSLDQGEGVARDPREAARLFLASLRKGARIALRDVDDRMSGWTRETLREVQVILQGAGLYQDTLDGRFGPAMKRALDAHAKRQ